jgi:hypothetical protein
MAATEMSALVGDVMVDRSLIRGVPLRYVLDNGAAILASQERAGQYDDGRKGGKASALPFSHSVARGQLDLFLSHSWRDSRLAKYLILLFATNHILAVSLATLASAAVLVLEAMGYKLRPLFTLCSEMPGVGAGVYCQSNGPSDLVFPLVYVLIFFTGHLVRPEKHIFLDVACIDQSNDEKKAAGIRSLGHVTSSSNTLLVCASPDYFERL